MTDALVEVATDDAAALLDGLGIQRAHVLGWSLGSLVAQELALRHAAGVGSLVMYGTWGRRDAFATALMTAVKHPWEAGDLAAALVSCGVVYSPDFLDSPETAVTEPRATPSTRTSPRPATASTD
jgi:pimeloyl-ACP methyl ester carboxylesterase